MGSKIKDEVLLGETEFISNPYNNVFKKETYEDNMQGIREFS